MLLKFCFMNLEILNHVFQGDIAVFLKNFNFRILCISWDLQKTCCFLNLKLNEKCERQSLCCMSVLPRTMFPAAVLPFGNMLSTYVFPLEFIFVLMLDSKPKENIIRVEVQFS